jgi:KDO2-lipid IV(A) lauroyltransferase|tara:strand:+ start:2325 stop:3173 length:849 start_codon:yes stop_codon:yes gene_type:complete
MTKYKLITTLHRVIKRLNIRILLLIAYPLGILYFIFTPISSFKLSRRKKNINNYSALKVKINYVKYWIETVWLSQEGYMSQIYDHVEIVNEEEVIKLNKNFNSFIIALPHVGNWEFAIPMGEKLNLNLLAVAEPLQDTKILDWFTDLREGLGCEIILGGKGQNTFNKLLERISEGYHVCLLADRHVGRSGVGVEFFNNMAAFPKGPVALSLETQVPIIPATFLYIDRKYKLVFGKPFIVPHFENDAQSIQHGLKVLSKEMEKLILLDPNQWHSIQPVWTSEY